MYVSRLPSRMEPELEDPVGVLAVLALEALSFLEVRARDPGVWKLPWVSAPGLLLTVGVQALGPVVGAGPRAALDLVHVHQVVVGLVVAPVLVAEFEVGAEGQCHGLGLHVNHSW